MFTHNKLQDKSAKASGSFIVFGDEDMDLSLNLFNFCSLKFNQKLIPALCSQNTHLVIIFFTQSMAIHMQKYPHGSIVNFFHCKFKLMYFRNSMLH